MTMSECFYNPTNQCGGQFSGASPPPDWKEVECDCCSAKFWACPNCAPTEDCYPPSCPGCRIPPPIGSPLPAGEEDPFREVEALVKGAARHPQHTPPAAPPCWVTASSTSAGWTAMPRSRGAPELPPTTRPTSTRRRSHRRPRRRPTPRRRRRRRPPTTPNKADRTAFGMMMT